MPYTVIVSQGRVADRTPGAIRGAALLGAALAERLGLSVTVCGTPSLPAADAWPEALAGAEPTLVALADAVKSALDGGSTPLLALNKCPASLATLPAAAAHWPGPNRTGAPEPGSTAPDLSGPGLKVLWIDAHGDFNTPTTTATGYLGGMVLAAACGLWDSGHGAGVAGENVVILGGHDLDEAEAALLAAAGATVLLPTLGSDEAVARAVNAALGDGPIWVHLDCDALEPGHVPADYVVPGGFSPATLKTVLAALPVERVVGIEIAEFEASPDAAESVEEPGPTTRQGLETLLDIVAPLLANLR
ncbi:MAG TPA: arginase family protein [Trueperaceae bacterium]|nr:arginase family protein [Trueperaceae bacterium]